MADELSGRRILVVEDEWILADAISDALGRAGGIVLGPVPSVEEGLQVLAAETHPPDAATLNIRLSDGESYPVADELARQGVPFVFASANGASTLPPRFARRPMVTKPFPAHALVQALAAMLDGQTSPIESR